MSRFKALLKYLGGIAAGAIIGFFSAKRKYGTGIIDILGGTTTWGGYEEFLDLYSSMDILCNCILCYSDSCS